MTEQTGAWGRIAEDGTVFVRTVDGERPVGSWLAGPPEAGLAFYQRKYDELATEVELLERRMHSGAGDTRATASTAARLRGQLAEANVVGDLAALESRLAKLLMDAQGKLATEKAAQAEASTAAIEKKKALAEEAEKLAKSSDWKSTGDRLRALVEEWREIKGVARRTDTELWRRVSAARDEFTRRRGAHFAGLDEQRKAAAGVKEKLAKEAETLAESSDWAATATRYKSLMVEWKAAGSAGKGAEDDLWGRFKAAQEKFFARRSEVFAERDKEFAGNAKTKEAILAEAEALDPAVDLDAATKALREIQTRWEAAGKVPRELMTTLERRMETVEKKFRSAAESKWKQTDVQSSPMVIRLRESVAKLESKVAKARAAGREADAAAAEETLATQREWLSQAEQG
ncbi:MAG: DUF349 domain-containing protein [Mycobacteriales bacterium]